MKSQLPKDKTKQMSEHRIGISTLERYTGSDAKQFQPYVLLTNFPKYLQIFADKFNADIHQGSAMSACHSAENKLTIIDYGIGSPVAALIIDLLSFTKPKAVLSLGLCGGLRGDEQKVGDYFNPVAAIREEGTSFAYLPERCPSLSSFVIQRYVCEELERNRLKYHTGVIHTTNVRFWEFNESFKQDLIIERAQAIDMECATLFTAGFSRLVPIGALMLISDLPLETGGIKTKESASKLFNKYSDLQIQIGINILKNMQSNEAKGFAYHF